MVSFACDILLIEDSASQAVYLKSLLERAGYTVRVATDGAAGWRLASTLTPRMILLDIELPTMNGFQVLSRLKRQASTAEIPVVMITNHATVEHETEALNLGAMGIVGKGGQWHEIAALVAGVLGGQPQESRAGQPDRRNGFASMLRMKP